MVTMLQKVEKYEAVLHEIGRTGAVYLDPDRFRELLDQIAAWDYAHRRGNAEAIDKAFVKLGT